MAIPPHILLPEDFEQSSLYTPEDVSKLENEMSELKNQLINVYIT